MKAYITIGLPGSGKSTKAKELLSANPNLVRANLDELRIMVMDEKGMKHTWKNAWGKEVAGEVSRRHNDIIKQAAREGKDVIVDNCHLSEGARKRIVWSLRNFGFENIEMLDFRDVPLEVCLKRNENREGFAFISPKAIRDLHAQHIEGRGNKMTQFRKLPNFDATDPLPVCLIVDVDGTLAQIVDRSPYDETRVFEDDVRQHVAMIVKRLGMTEADHVFVFSGRTNGCRQDTQRWLQEKAGFNEDFSWSLHMRTVGDKRRDGIIKTELFNEFIVGKFNVLAVFDDRAQVIRECWKVLNVPVFRCGVIDEDDF